VTESYSRQSRLISLEIKVTTEYSDHPAGSDLINVTIIQRQHTRMDRGLSAWTIVSHMPGNAAVTINAEKGEFHLVALKGIDKPDEVETAKGLIQSRLAQTDLVDVLIDMDNETDFLRHFLHCGGPSRLPVAERRRNILAALSRFPPQNGSKRHGASEQAVNVVPIIHLL
jgi:hypothetical protein